MKLLPLLALGAVFILGGCATNIPSTASPSASADPATTQASGFKAPATSPRLAEAAKAPTAPALLPTGPLSPLVANGASSNTVAPLTPPSDLWERIRQRFGMPDLQHELVQDREQWYATRPDYIQRMTERSSKYIFHIVEELERRNMPSELALLPYIESAFNPQAVSSAKAAGMWQFMPATGRYFDLKQNAFRDDRRDVLASTRAALDYLQKLYGMFGDWHLALAAYNWGEGSVSRAIERNRKAGLGTTYLDINMPAETRMYVPKLQAVKNIVAAPQRYATTLPLIENHPYFQTVTITRDIDVALAAKLADVAPEDFRALNPAASQPVILASATPEILLPWDNAAVFRANLMAKGNAQLASWTAWQAPGTMQPSEVARRVGMSEDELREVNKIPRGMLIKAGSTLLVARSADVREDVAQQIADNAQLTLSRQPLQARRTVRAGKSDTVASLARRYGVAASAIADWNDVKVGAKFKAGESVVVYLPVRESRPTRVAASSSKAKPRATAPAASQRKSKPVRMAKR
jgi:membrane-bound lytic murein transglycosylase D